MSEKFALKSKGRTDSILFLRGLLVLGLLLAFVSACGPDPFFVPVMDIVDVPDTGTAGEPLTLGTVSPGFANKRDIVWTVEDAGTTGASVSGNQLHATGAGTVSITGKVVGGGESGADYVSQVFDIDIVLPKLVTSITVLTQPTKLSYAAGQALDLTGLEVTLTFDDSTTVVVPYTASGFAARKLTANPAHGTTLSSTYNGSYIDITWNGVVPVSIAPNYVGPLAVKAPGDPVGPVVLTGGINGSQWWINVDAPIGPLANGQNIEYAISDTTTAPATGWQSTPGFWTDFLDHTKDYYIFARSEENPVYAAGTPSVSGRIAFYNVTFDTNGGSSTVSEMVTRGDLVPEPPDPIKTDPVSLAPYTFAGWYKEAALINQWNFAVDKVTASMTLYAKWVSSSITVTLTVENIVNGDPVIAGGMTLSRTGTGHPVTATVSIPAGYTYTTSSWKIAGVNGPAVTNGGASFDIDATDIRYNSLGGHVLELTVVKDGMTYVVNINFNIVN